VVRYRLNLIQLFITTSQFAKAQTELQQAERLDRLGAHRAMIMEHARMLHDAMTRSNVDEAADEPMTANHPSISSIMGTQD